MQTPIPLSLYDLTCEQLAHQLAEWGEPAFRARQVWHWLYQRLASSIDEMTDLPRPLRDRLKQTYVLGRMTLVTEQHSSDGWTRKWLFRLADGSEIETVLMEYDGLRRTACVSSQAGCAMGCSFCATGQMGFLRNLRSGEIVEQALWAARALRDKTHGNERLSNLVLMGMGEPFANYNNVMEAARRLMTPEHEGGFGLGARKITLSTVGLVAGIRRFAEEAAQINLAVSLHAATDALRDQLVPINRRYPLRELTAATRDYLRKTNRRVSYEWALIDGVNDTVEQARALVELVRQTNPRAGVNLVHVNLIPLNPTSGYDGHASRRARIHRFRDVLTQADIPNTLRIRRGIDINAGCGQLKAKTAQTGLENQTGG
ncbi:MAG: 23S rRNA (adenine(2503)-C(2))-methyltransferase RlmN [Chloroflexi bacterium]|jgi:23S rRNA (adenine2503-C2)-methyltransferase|uniref:Probable dual-specificity RNA methyltransferase RlmN n=1 Tax=Candidatus Thermofonsia Clade 3 bacterium TaxID=2364212 RepID=A0A2M8QG39_9CHLR|nr:23S rRNA (adenine(2503)-C(2))-methyltransferase RlmN [Candidatus Roseilinea sp. NK_OTU-006]PJF48781.1 MAG: 23S rRNA (adenine(2503)-C(2))-methyltransferase RlmN [Candidatus Thermofonsia Clade 3 bacterium]RMG63612.1 MAG: 23S rRNA (adenine(2503)-C(2))-methyltransferase RlmN [Chloroflexota bacterium]